MLNPHAFTECGGVSAVLHGILDCALPRVNEALLSSILYLMNSPEWRESCSEFHMIVAPFTDPNYKHYDQELEYCSKSYVTFVLV